jgi:hypothetical protein
MHNLLTSIVLCFLAQAASAQCLNVPATPVTAAARPGVELIATAAADTRDAPLMRHTAAVSGDAPVMRTTAAVSGDGPVMRQTAATTRSKPQPNDGEEHRRPTGAMLLAALALMSGIALRRASASGQ